MTCTDYVCIRCNGAAATGTGPPACLRPVGTRQGFCAADAAVRSRPNLRAVVAGRCESRPRVGLRYRRMLVLQTDASHVCRVHLRMPGSGSTHSTLSTQYPEYLRVSQQRQQL